MMNHLSQLFRSNLQKGWEKTKPASVSMPTRTIRSVSGFAPVRWRYHLLQWTRLMTKPILSLEVSSYRKWYRKMPFPAKIINFKSHVRKDLVSKKLSTFQNVVFVKNGQTTWTSVVTRYFTVERFFSFVDFKLSIAKRLLLLLL